MTKKVLAAEEQNTLITPVPHFDEPIHVGRPNIGAREDFLNRVTQILDRRWLSNDGPVLQEFEASVADYLKVKHCIAMCNGTIALEIAIRACDLKGEVIIPSYTFIATAHALHWQGIKPVFADIQLDTHNLDPDAVRRAITPQTTGIIGVHLWGRGAAHEELNAIAEEHQLVLMYDAAHAFACSLGGKMIGNFGKCEVLSFHATKFFNTFEGGAVVTNDDELAKKMRLMRNFGFSGYDNVIHPGTNGKMIEICAAMGLTNLDYVDTVIAANKNNYLAYHRALDRLPGIRVMSFSEAEKNNYQYVILEVQADCKASRDQIVAALHRENILARKYFWPGCHNMQPYREIYPDAGLALPNTQRVADSVIVLPTGTTLPDTAIDVIANTIGLTLDTLK
jgi:dTDP-4-amino-4,6-dideoxygalactose transaminase